MPSPICYPASLATGVAGLSRATPENPQRQSPRVLAYGRCRNLLDPKGSAKIQEVTLMRPIHGNL